jgi:hypothetical protein
MRGALALPMWLIVLGCHSTLPTARHRSPDEPSSELAVKPKFKPKHGYVPDARTAIKIAVAVWEAIYGEEKIAGEKPYRARLTNGVWTVEGSLPAGSVGGVAIAEIAKNDGKILRVIHEQ